MRCWSGLNEAVFSLIRMSEDGEGVEAIYDEWVRKFFLLIRQDAATCNRRDG